MIPGQRPILVSFIPAGKTVRARAGDTLLDSALDNGVWIEHECGGNCTCTTCHVLVRAGGEGLSPMEEPERYRLQLAPGRRAESRLACQALLVGGSVAVEIPSADEDEPAAAP